MLVERYEEDEDDEHPLGKVSHLALSASMKNLAIYTDSGGKGNMFVIDTQNENVLNLNVTGIANADGLAWVGDDAICLTFEKKLFLIGPNESKKEEYKATTGGIFMLTECDGMRLVTSNDTHFID
jgi:hypothetical protein